MYLLQSIIRFSSTFPHIFELETSRMSHPTHIIHRPSYEMIKSERYTEICLIESSSEQQQLNRYFHSNHIWPLLAFFPSLLCSLFFDFSTLFSFSFFCCCLHFGVCLFTAAVERSFTEKWKIIFLPSHSNFSLISYGVTHITASPDSLQSVRRALRETLEYSK